MRFDVVAAAACVSLLSTMARAEEERHLHDHRQSSDAPITITINPEARVSVVLSGALPASVACGKATAIPVMVVNHGFLTSTLEADLVGYVPTGVKIAFHGQPLKGAPEELRELRITLTEPGATDITVAFKAHHGSPDLGGRDRIHFLMRCTGPG